MRVSLVALALAVLVAGCGSQRNTLDRLWRTAIRPLIAEYFIPPAGEVEEYAALFAEAAAALDSENG